MAEKRRSLEERQRKPLEYVAFIYSLKCGFALILIFQIAYLLGKEYGGFWLLGRFRSLTDLGNIKYVNFIVLFYVIFKGTRTYKIRHNFAAITYQKSVLSGLIISILSIAFITLYSVIFYKYIDPDSLNLVMQNEYLNPEITKVERALNFLRPYGITFIVSIVYTFLISFVLIKKERSH
jgi:hypothetical protein